MIAITRTFETNEYKIFTKIEKHEIDEFKELMQKTGREIICIEESIAKGLQLFSKIQQELNELDEFKNQTEQ